jgi:hypothetical protein
MSTEDVLALHLRELEESLLLASVRKSGRVAQLLADNFVEFGSSGRLFTKEQIVASLCAESPTIVTTTEFKVVLLAPGAALVTYRAHRHTEPPVYTLRSSLWQMQNGQWKMIFHQGTLSPARQ